MDHQCDSLNNPAVPGAAGGLIVTLFALALTILLSQVALIAFGDPEGVRFTEQGLSPSYFTLLALCSAAGFLTVSGLLGVLFRGPIDLGLRRDALMPAAVALAAVFLANVAGTTVGRWIGEDYGGAPDLSSRGTAATGAVLVAVLLAPAVEELFFREMLLARVLAGTPRWLAITATAIAFGAFHLAAGGLALVLTLALMGGVLAWLRLRTGSLSAPFLVHALNNAIAIAFLS